jgi:hypothetical protein
MTVNKLINRNVFSRLFYGVIFGGIIGSITGVITGAVGSCLYWIYVRHLYPTLYGDRPLGSFVPGDIIMFGIPLGLLIGISTGLHHAIFKQYSLNSLVWVVVTGLGTIGGVLASGFGTDYFLGFIFEVAFIGLAASWLAHKITTRELKVRNGQLKRGFLIISSISGFLLIFTAIYGIFKFWLYLINIPS